MLLFVNVKQQKRNHACNVAMTADRTWMKRGFTSVHGVTTGQVLDYEVLSRFCSQCSKRSCPLNEEPFSSGV